MSYLCNFKSFVLSEKHLARTAIRYSVCISGSVHRLAFGDVEQCSDGGCREIRESSRDKAVFVNHCSQQSVAGRCHLSAFTGAVSQTTC